MHMAVKDTFQLNLTKVEVELMLPPFLELIIKSNASQKNPELTAVDAAVAVAIAIYLPPQGIP
ncbi:hypothetical protein Patl1_09352 [Pistacia atlantica]|uniref:Uncharacterized protein n=1 Tax=Pistacia atlantica TaxID=434234 RepID=A0ACC1AGY6_9ROSI|nr:hypothetical protein Patl1_09352 [Pistacia atlantica]